MPYVKDEYRKILDPAIAELARGIVDLARALPEETAFAGLLNYACTSTAMRVLDARFGKEFDTGILQPSSESSRTSPTSSIDVSPSPMRTARLPTTATFRCTSLLANAFAKNLNPPVLAAVATCMDPDAGEFVLPPCVTASMVFKQRGRWYARVKCPDCAAPLRVRLSLGPMVAHCAPCAIDVEADVTDAVRAGNA